MEDPDPVCRLCCHMMKYHTTLTVCSVCDNERYDNPPLARCRDESRDER